MSCFVADANAVLSVLLPEEDPALAEKFETQLRSGLQLAVPSLWHIEVSNVPLSKARRGKITFEEAQEIFATLQSYRVRTDRYSSEPSVLSHIWRLAIKHGLTSYDATYLELAIRLCCPLLTADHALCRAAASEGVALL